MVLLVVLLVTCSHRVVQIVVVVFVDDDGPVRVWCRCRPPVSVGVGAAIALVGNDGRLLAGNMCIRTASMLACVKTWLIRWNKARDKWRLTSRERRNILGGPAVAR